MNELIVSSSPHIYSDVTIDKIMQDVIIALIPVTITSIYFFNYKAFLIIIISIVTCILTEKIFNKLFKRKSTFNNPAAIITGMLFAFTLPPEVPLLIVAIGAFSGILFGKLIFGGLGSNPFNPALVGRAILLSSWPVYLTKWSWPQDLSKYVSKYYFDTVSMATPLGIVKEHGINELYQAFSKSDFLLYYKALFIGNRAGSIGETSTLAILIGAAYLIYKRHITLHVPLTYILTVFLLSIITKNDILFQLMSGGLMIGAFFMATDYVTTPFYSKSKIIFGIGCGILTFLIRTKGGFPEGVCYSILIMNMFTPLMNRYIRPKKYGSIKKTI